MQSSNMFSKACLHFSKTYCVNLYNEKWIPNIREYTLLLQSETGHVSLKNIWKDARKAQQQKLKWILKDYLDKKQYHISLTSSSGKEN
jgi:hypothetical protein